MFGMREMQKNTAKNITAILSLALMFSGCGSDKQRIVSTDQLRTCIMTDIGTIDPIKCVDQPTHSYFMNQVFETLVKYDENSNFTQGLAENWTISKDNLVYTFYIRNNILFHNGKEVKAIDFKKSFERMCNPKTVSPGADKFLGNVLGAMDCIRGRTKHVQGLEVLDDHTLKITTTAADPLFLHKLAYTTLSVVDVDAIGGVDKDMTLQTCIGTGPYKLNEFVSGAYISLKANEDYWDDEKPIIKNIQIDIIPDTNTQLANYKAGKLDFLQVAKTQIPEVMENEELASQLKTHDTAAVYYLAFDNERYPPFQNKDFRLAIIKAIDKKKILDTLQGTLISQANGIIPSGFPGYSSKTFHYKFDPVSARKHLQYSGYNIKNLPTLELTTADSPTSKKICENIHLQLKENLGISVKVSTFDFNTFNQKLYNKGFAISYSGWSADYMDPASYLLDLFHSSSPLNKSKFKDNTFDYLTEKAQNTSNADMLQRFNLFSQAENQLISSGYVLPIIFIKDAYLTKPNLVGLKMNIMNLLPFNTVRFN